MNESIKGAADKRELGIQRSVDRADANIIGWSTDAASHVAQFCVRKKDLIFDANFLAEDVREWCEINGLSAPTDGRAWGSVMRRAAKAGLIRPVGYAPSRSSNLSPKVLWRAA